MVEHPARERHQLPGGPREPARELDLAVAGLDQRLGEQQAQRLGVARHAGAEHARDVERLLQREARLGERGRVLGRLEILLGEHARVGIGDREAERLPVGGELLELEAGLLREVALAVLRLTGQEALDREQHEPILLDRLAQLVDAAALLVEVVEQLAAGRARIVVLESFEQPLGFPVHGDPQATRRRTPRRAGPSAARRASSRRAPARTGASRRRAGSRPPRRRGSRARWPPPGRS